MNMLCILRVLQKMDKEKERYFTQKLMKWHEADNDRSLPWKEEKDPYRIWLSEIILQQTRAEQGLPYYLRFTEAYPDVIALANAVDEEVFRLWQGLGYYARCRNMLASARQVKDAHSGIFPKTYDEILALKGVGAYTAAAIASFAYGLPHAVVDGNVYRVLSRYFGIDTPIDSTQGKKGFTELANRLLDAKDSAGYNQAIMDLGATVCKPAAPLCVSCPLQKNCFACQKDIVADLPVKGKKLIIKKRYFNYIFLLNAGKVWIQKRSEKDIWQNLHEPLLIEQGESLTATQLLKNDELQRLKIQKSGLKHEWTTAQRLTHRIVEMEFYTARISEPETLKSNGMWVDIKDLSKYAFPKSIVSFLEKKSYFY